MPTDSKHEQTGMYVPREQPGTLIAGRYKLLEEIGEGGMGTVWVAEQTQPVRRKVALKLIKAGMDSNSILARFEAERQALALMDHSNIAKVLDGGLTEQARPFFVMEYVKGVPITEYCEATRLSVPERLNLFVQVCSAVQHAHQKGIIHRDLKPSNILVAPYDDKPVPKVIDFGLAKAMHQPLTERTLHTAHETVLGTPVYMSPEQAQLNNLDVDTRSDIYSLGVLLYELLTGSTPLEKKRLKEAAWDEVRRLIRQEEPPRPSTRLSSANTLPSLAAARQTDPARLTKLVRGELDWIVMKSLEKDRARRYGTATGFALDIQRYLAGEPVLAVPPSARYLLRKFVGKHRVALAMAAAIALLFASGVAAVVAVQTAATARLTDSLDRETRANAALAAANDELTRSRAAVQARYDLAVDAIKTFHTGDNEEFLLKEDRFKELRDRRFKSAADFYVKLGALLGKETDIASRRALAQSNFELANLMDKVGRKEDALATHRAVLAAREALAAEPGADASVKVDVGRSLTEVASLLYSIGKAEEALAAYRRSELLLAELAGPDPAARAALAACRTRMALHLQFAGKYAETLVALESARKDQELPATVRGASSNARHEFAETVKLIGFVLWFAGKPVEAEPELRAAMRWYQELSDENPAVSEFRRGLAKSRYYLGNVLSLQGKKAEAEAELRWAVTLHVELTEKNAAVTEDRRSLAVCRAYLGYLLTDTGRPAEAEVEYRAALRLEKILADDNPAVPDLRSVQATVQTSLGVLLLQMGKPAEAEEECRKAQLIMQNLVDDNPAVVVFRGRHHTALTNLGDVVRSLGRPGEAKGLYERAIALKEPKERGKWETAYDVRALRRRGLALRDLGDLPGAAADFRQAQVLTVGLPPLGFEFETACCHAGLAGLAGRGGSGVSVAEGKTAADKAMQWLRQAVDMGYRNANEIRIESALDPLRGREDFQKLVKELEATGGPKEKQ
jgi:tetratricopeptide (TPR) repeat protein